MRAADISDMQRTFPRMDLSALYCLGITIQEYARYLNTDLVTQKRQLEKKPVLDTFLEPKEIQEQSASGLIEKYKAKPAIQPKNTSIHVVPRPNLEDDFNSAEKIKRARTRQQIEVKTSNKETEQDKMMKHPEWKGALTKTRRNHEEESSEASKRRAESEKEKARIRAERKRNLERQRQREERRKQLQSISQPPLEAETVRYVKQEPVDMFDLSNESLQKPLAKKRKLVSKKKSSGF
jgi:hypothetical protein